jgi:hypothetical protein
MNESIELTYGRTDLYPAINKFVNDEWEKLRRGQITPWALLQSGKGFLCKYFDETKIQYQGEVIFEGSPREVFWGHYIEPFLEDISYRAIDQAIHLCKDKNVRLNEPLLETTQLLKLLFRKTFNLMADIDRGLRGRGYPQNIEKRGVDAEIAAMDKFIDTRVESDIRMYKTKSISERLNDFYHKYQLLLWIVGITVGLFSVALGIAALYK